MIAAANHPVYTRLMRFYIDRRMRRSFSRILFEGECAVEPDVPLLILSNHTGWWDGFWIERLVRYRMGRNLRVMMTHEALSANRMLRYMGGFAAGPGVHDRSAMLRYAVAQLDDPKNALLLFPQGALYSLYEEQVLFKPGAAYLIERATRTPRVLFVALMVEYGSEPRPAVYLYCEASPCGVQTTSELERAYGDFFARTRCGHRQKMSAR
ncbi:MAG: 1-acyl-sn-glycerol-3-phosphate acyltransferase [Bacteroidales bacterium]